MFRLVSPPIIRSTYKCIYSIWYLYNSNCYQPLSWMIWNSNSSTIAVGSRYGRTSAKCCRYSLRVPDDGWRYQPKHVERFPDINKLCNVASCWTYIGTEKMILRELERLLKSICPDKFITDLSTSALFNDAVSR
jgi:hypothetical protein